MKCQSCWEKRRKNISECHLLNVFTLHAKPAHSHKENKDYEFVFLY